MPFPGTDFPVAMKEVVVSGTGLVTSYFFYLGSDATGYLCKTFVNGTLIGEYNSKANARTAANLAGA